METVAHVYANFAPVGIALLASCGILSADGAKASLRRRIPAVAGLWLASSVAAIALIVTASAPALHTAFVARRDLGYWLGGAVGIAPLFIACIALANMAPLQRARASFRFLSLAVVSLLLFLAVPQCFAVGWVAGCALLWYPSCM